jgi:hypothetical protein
MLLLLMMMWRRQLLVVQAADSIAGAVKPSVTSAFCCWFLLEHGWLAALAISVLAS